MERMNAELEKRILQAMPELGFEGFILIGVWRDPEKKGERYKTWYTSFPDREVVRALADSMTSAIVSKPALIPFFQEILDRATKELTKQAGDRPT